MAPTDPSASVQAASVLSCRLCQFRLVWALLCGHLWRHFCGGGDAHKKSRRLYFRRHEGQPSAKRQARAAAGVWGWLSQHRGRNHRLASVSAHVSPHFSKISNHSGPRTHTRRRCGPSHRWNGAVQTEPVWTSKAFLLTPVTAGRCHYCSPQRWCYCGQSVGVPSRAGAGHLTWHRKVDFLTSSHSLHVVGVVGVLLSHPHPRWCPLQLTRLVPGPLCGRPLASPSQSRSLCVRVLGYEMSTRKKQHGLGQDWVPQQLCSSLLQAAGAPRPELAPAAVEPARAKRVDTRWF